VQQGKTYRLNGKIGLRHSRQGNDNRRECSEETNGETFLVQAIEESGL